MHPDEQAILRAVLARPDDDLPRLVMADWWDENGQGERAEFCRAQCELARTSCDLGWQNGYCCDRSECRPCALRRRERELLFDHGFKWGREAVPVPAGYKHTRHHDNDFHVWSNENLDGMQYSFRRGFVEFLICSWSDFRQHADAICRATPLREMTLTTWPAINETGVDVLAWLQCEYPGITFHLPNVGSVVSGFPSWGL
jgi:uncharacterized protein (TIGR02996 family)